MAASPSLACAIELIQGTDPKDARRILDPTIEAMMRAVHRYEGTVNKVAAGASVSGAPAGSARLLGLF
jgi:hypothetical protein